MSECSYNCVRLLGWLLTVVDRPVTLLFTADKRGGICFRPHARARLSVCLCARLLENACMDLDEMLRVDRCRDMDELINF